MNKKTDPWRQSLVVVERYRVQIWANNGEREAFNALKRHPEAAYFAVDGMAAPNGATPVAGFATVDSANAWINAQE